MAPPQEAAEIVQAGSPPLLPPASPSVCDLSRPKPRAFKIVLGTFTLAGLGGGVASSIAWSLDVQYKSGSVRIHSSTSVIMQTIAGWGGMLLAASVLFNQGGPDPRRNRQVVRFNSSGDAKFGIATSFLLLVSLVAVVFVHLMQPPVDYDFRRRLDNDLGSASTNRTRDEFLRSASTTSESDDLFRSASRRRVEDLGSGGDYSVPINVTLDVGHRWAPNVSWTLACDDGSSLSGGRRVAIQPPGSCVRM